MSFNVFSIRMWSYESTELISLPTFTQCFTPASLQLGRVQFRQAILFLLFFLKQRLSDIKTLYETILEVWWGSFAEADAALLPFDTRPSRWVLRQQLLFSWASYILMVDISMKKKTMKRNLKMKRPQSLLGDGIYCWLIRDNGNRPEHDAFETAAAARWEETDFSA